MDEAIKKFRVAVSGGHLHLTQELVDVLFGKGHEIKPEVPTKGQFLSTSRVKVTGPKDSFDNVAIMGPCRNFNQFEISISDAFRLGVSPVVRMSGDIADTPGIKIAGPSGDVELTEGVIVAKRHIHLNPLLAEEYDLKDGDSVMLRIDSVGRSLIFDDTIVKTGKNPQGGTVAHIDTDEGNAAGISKVSEGYIIRKV